MKGKTPFEMVYGKNLDVFYLRVWGGLPYVHVQRDKRDGFGSDIGYTNGYKAWKFYDPVSRKVLIA